MKRFLIDIHADGSQPRQGAAMAEVKMFIVEAKTKRGHSNYVQSFGRKRGFGFSKDASKARRFEEEKAKAVGECMRDWWGDLYAVSIKKMVEA